MTIGGDNKRIWTHYHSVHLQSCGMCFDANVQRLLLHTLQVMNL